MFDDTQKNLLLETAASSIQHGLLTGQALTVNHEDYPDAFQVERASFVTLHINGDLRGCIGSLQATRSLISDVAENAFAAAFRDPRFPRLTEHEYTLLHYHISVLNPPEPMQFSSEQELINSIRPNVDGLVLEDKGQRGTFLPSVWESLPQPEDFLRHLKVKAGLPIEHWSETLTVQRYTVEDIEE